MKNFNSFCRSLSPVALALVTALAPAVSSCDEAVQSEILSPSSVEESVVSLSVTPESVARMLSEIPLSPAQVREVWIGVTASSGNGYDEEYPFKNLILSPGTGVGDSPGTRAAESFERPLRTLLEAYAEAAPAATKSTAIFMSELSDSDLQIYWPYSENWDGETTPVITFVPEPVRDSNLGFLAEILPDGSRIVKEVVVDEAYAASHPVWVVNHNTDAGAMTPQLLSKLGMETPPTRASSDFKTLKLKEFKAHRQYDPWLCGGSEFFIKCGSIKAFTAAVVSDMTLYNPEITDLMIKVKRSQVGKSLRYNSILVSEWSSQLSECAFLMTEDDGGKMTSWKCSGKVTIKSKSYGFDVEIPYHKNDDIVWRGKLSSSYFDKYNGTACRYGDVSVTFAFD